MKKQVFIDGIVQEIEDDDPMFRREGPNITYETTEENFQLASKVYDQARRIKRLLNNPDFMALLQDLEEQEKMLSQGVLSDRNAELDKKKWQAYRDVRMILDYLRNTMEDAANVPRPILVPQEK
jgi:hypothetical protein